MHDKQEKMSAVECANSYEVDEIIGLFIKIFFISGILFTIATFLVFFFPLTDGDFLSKITSPIMAIVFFRASTTLKYLFT